MEDFNKAAASPAAPDPAQETTAKILAAVAKSRLNLSLTEAAERKDWTAALELVEQGADPTHRFNAALNIIVKSSDIGAQRVLQKIKLPGYYAPHIAEFPLLNAAYEGNRATVDDALARGVSADILSRALGGSLFGKQDDIADLLLEALPKKNMTDNALFGLLVHRPALYDEAVKARTETDPTDSPNYIGFFYNAAILKDAAAMDKALDAMIAHKEKLPLYLMIMDFDDMSGPSAYGDVAFKVMRSGHMAVLDRFIENFSHVLPGRTTMLHIAANLEAENPGVLKHYAEKIAATGDEIARVLRGHGGLGAAAAAYFLDAYPEQAKAEPAAVLIPLAKENPALFLKAVNDAGVPLPAQEALQSRLYAAAIEHGHKDVEDYLAAHLPDLAAIEATLAGDINYTIEKHVAAASGSYRFGKDALFWNAVQQDDREILAKIPREPKISTDTSWKVGNALEEVVRRGDMALLRDIVDHAAWDRSSLLQLTRTSMRSPEAIEVLAEKGLLPEKLEETHLYGLVEHGGVAAIASLEAKGMKLEGEQLTDAVRLAVNKNMKEVLGHLMAKAPELQQGITPFIAAIDHNADRETLSLLEKWRTRAQVIPAAGIAQEIASAPDLFAGEDSVAVRAAYSNEFASVMKKAAQQAGFDPAVLVSTKDRYGSSVLEILGAHGRLEEILEPAALWRDRDAVAFIEGNTPRAYHEKVNYNGLKAALDLARLNAGRNDRFRLKP